MAEKLIKYKIAELNAKPKWGKTIATAITARLVHHKVQPAIPPGAKRRNTMVLNFSPMAPFDKDKCVEFGAFDDVSFTAGNKQHVKALHEHVRNNGVVSVYSTKEAFNAMAGTKRESKEDFGFADLTVAHVHTSKPKTLPKLAELVDTLCVKNLIIVVDEHQGLLGQSSQNFASLIANHVALSQASWKSPEDRYNVYIIAASATAEAKSPSVSHKVHVSNMELFYLQRDPMHETKTIEDIEKEVWVGFRNKITVSVTPAQEKASLDNFQWQTGTESAVGGKPPRSRNNIIAAPSNGAVVERLEQALLMQALMDNTQVWVRNWGDIFIENERVALSFQRAKPKSPSEGQLVLSPGCVQTSVRGYQSCQDVVRFLRGQFVPFGNIEINSWVPQRPLMRRVTKITGNAQNPVEVKDVRHFHCVLVVISQISQHGLEPLRAACAEDNPRTKIYDCTQFDNEALVELVDVEIKKEFLENRRQIYIVTKLSQVVGANCFGDFVTACVTIGNIPPMVRQQCYERLARCTTPWKDMVVPKQGEYKFFHLGSHATQRLDTDLNHANSEDAFKAMVADESFDKYKNTNKEIDDSDKKAAKAYRKFLFYSTGGINNKAEPIKIGGGVELSDQYVKLWKEKKQDSEDWQKACKKFLTWVAHLRA